ncbi:MAG: hypothetical protein RL198_610 [Actinomycetota bacterium]
MFRRIGVLLVAVGLLTAVAQPALAADDVAADYLQIAEGSSVNLVAREAAIPFTVINSGVEPAEVTLRGEAASFRIQVLSSATATIPGQSSALIEIPVRAIANGPAGMRIWLEQDGERVGTVVPVQINVNYDLETYLLVLFAGMMAALMLVGGIRTGMRLSRRNRGES